MKVFDKPHPFKISVRNNSVFINGGRVYCFYNPLNFQNVRWDSKKPFLPQEPIPVSEELQREEGINTRDYGISIPVGTVGINVHLMASFLPPKKWVPSHFYIPIIQRAWIVLVCTKADGEDLTSEIKGSVLNLTNDNIRYQSFDINLPVPENEEVYNPEPNPLGNAWNLGLLGQVEKIENNWKIVQCISDHFPITPFRNLWSYAGSNTEIYDQNILTELSNETPEEGGKSDYLIEIEKKEKLILKNPLLNTLPGQINVPNRDTHRGHIIFSDFNNIRASKFAQPKFSTFTMTDVESISPPGG